jgi:hypothetical protein
MTTTDTSETAAPGYEPPAIDHRQALAGLLALFGDTSSSDPGAGLVSAHFG